MARVVFYGKPTCGGNARQRALLLASGHELEARDLFTHPWTAASLGAFLDPLPPADWFNRSAVKVKSGAVVPEALDRAAAMALLLADPPLIRRPLMEVEGRRLVGWDSVLLDRLIGLKEPARPVTEACITPHPGACASRAAEAGVAAPSGATVSLFRPRERDGEWEVAGTGEGDSRTDTPAPGALPSDKAVDFGPLPEEIDALLQEGVIAHRTDVGAADALFRAALARAPDALPVYLCLYKIHTYSGRLDAALEAAEAGLQAAAAQAGLSADWRTWPPLSGAEGAARFALYTLKATAFIRLRRNEGGAAGEILDALARIDPADHVGGSVVAALAEGTGRAAP